VGKLGYHVGPELTDLSHRSLEDLLSNILDPNMAINPAFVSYNVELDSGDLETGLLKTSGGDTIVLLQAQEKQIAIPRQKVRKFRSSGVSLMPEGFETVLTMQQMRDLLAFLLEPR
jgi:putative heme-binding domain-containing protein